MAEINQREEWWINFPVYQAKLKGAIGFVAVQAGGYGEVADNALNAQDIAGPCDAPAFSISRTDADFIKRCMAKEAENEEASGRECTVLFDAYTKVVPDSSSYNIVGEIPGETGQDDTSVKGLTTRIFRDFQVTIRR